MEIRWAVNPLFTWPALRDALPGGVDGRAQCVRHDLPSSARHFVRCSMDVSIVICWLLVPIILFAVRALSYVHIRFLNAHQATVFNYSQYLVLFARLSIG